jgi:alkyl sulfatase BDS1-like metallo-beta-lactamase superfamily hydrolase
MNKILGSALLITLLALGGCGKNTGVGGTAGDAETATQKANELIAQELNLADPLDFEDAKRGFIAAPEGKIMAADGTTVLIDFDAYKFIDGKAPATVNPSLWRHATLNKGVGLYKVRDGVHQLRGFDISNITLIDGKTGWIVVDRPHLPRELGRGDGLRAQAPGQQAGHGRWSSRTAMPTTSAARSGW